MVGVIFGHQSLVILFTYDIAFARLRLITIDYDFEFIGVLQLGKLKFKEE